MNKITKDKIIAPCKEIQPFSSQQPQFIYVDDKQQVSFQSIEPMEITITHTKKETKISLSNRLAGMVEKESITGIIKNLIDLAKEIQKL